MTRAQLHASIALWGRRLAYRTKQVKAAKTPAERAKWQALVNHAAAVIHRRRLQLDHSAPPLRVRALAEAQHLVGLMEVGGNNAGPGVTRIIKENGGTGPEPWCGDFLAHCYRHAGSTVVQRGWASTTLLGFLTGQKIIPLSMALPGDILVYNFGSGGAKHCGLLEELQPGGQLLAIEGNTGKVGAVSDSTTGGDGVYKKQRPQSFVLHAVRVLR